MSEFKPIRFGPRGGLGITGRRQTQKQLQRLDNADLALDGVVRKTPGTLGFAPTRSADPADVIPGTGRAAWTRGDEVLQETEAELYSLNRCAAGDASAVPVGTATPGEIAAASAALAKRAALVQSELVPLPGDAQAAAAQTRLDRPDIPPPLVQVAPRAVTVTITEPNPGRLSWTLTEGASTNGPNPLPGSSAQSLQRLARTQASAVSQNVTISYLDNGGLRAIRLVLLPDPASVAVVNYGQLGAVRGSPAAARYEARDGVICALLREGGLSLFVWDSNSPTSGVRAYAPASGLPDATTGGYGFDVSAPSGYNAPVMVAYTSPASAELVWLRTDTGGGSILDETSADPLAADADRVALVPSPTGGDPGRYVVGVRLTGQKPVCEVGPVDPVLRFVQSNSTTTVVYKRTSNVITTQWDGGPGPILADRLVAGIATPTDCASHRDAAGVFVGMVDASGYREARIDRELVPPDSILREADVQAVGLVGSTTRTIYAHYLTDTSVRVGVYTSTLDTSPSLTAFTVAATLDPAGAIGLGILAEDGVTGVTLRIYMVTDPAAKVLYAATMATTAVTVADVESHVVNTSPDVLAVSPAGAIPRALLGVKSSETQLIYEDSPALFVQVAPGGTALLSGNWRYRGPWSRMRHRVQRIRSSLNFTIGACSAVTVTTPQGLACSLVGTQQSGIDNGVVVDIVSSYTELTQVVSATGLHPRTAAYEQGTGVIGYIDVDNANTITRALWTPGTPLSFAPTNVTANGPAGVWDMAGGQSGNDAPCTLVVGCQTAQTLGVEIQSKTGTDLLSLAQGADIVDVSAFVRSGVGDTVRGSVAVALSDSTVRAYSLTLSPLAPTVAVDWSRVFAVASLPVAVASAEEADALTHTVWVERPAGGSRTVEFWSTTSGAAALFAMPSGGRTITALPRCALYANMAMANSQTMGVVETLSADADDSLAASGVLLLATQTGEVVGRSALAQTSLMDDVPTRDARYPHGCLVPDDAGGLSLGAPLRDLTQRSRVHTLAAMLRWPADIGPHRPAVVDEVAYAAHGGYPRQYDGELVYETDWHVLPTIAAIAVPLGALSTGSYTIAATWQYVNFQGQIERSAPTFFGPLAVTAGQAIQVTVTSLVHTERDEPTITLWRTLADGAGNVLYQAAQDLAQFGAGLISLGQSDADIQLNPRFLDQVAGGILTADRVGATDLMGVANGRIWTIEPTVPTHARYSVQQRAGFALHFSGAAIMEHPREETITSVHELAGRVVLLTANGVAYAHGDGPGNTGLGSYTVPIVEHVEVGATSHPATTTVPDGVMFESGQGVRLLTRGLQVVDMAEDVAARAERDGYLAQALTYSPLKSSAVVADRTAAGARGLLLLHVTTIRWQQWTSPAPLDLATLRAGAVAILSENNRVHLTDEGIYDRGGESYVFLLDTPWLTVGGGVPAHRAANFLTVRGFGDFAGDHDLLVDIFADYVDVPVVSGIRPLADTAAIASSGRPYIWQMEIPGQLHYAIKIRIRDNGETNATFALEGVDMEFVPTGKVAFGNIPADMKVSSNG